MSRTILSLILAFGLISCISAVSGAPDAYADDFIKKFAGKYYNSTNTTATPAEDKNATDVADAESAVADPACAQTLNKTNEAISAFAESVGTAKDKWSLLGSISRLGGQSYSLGFNCKPENLKFINAGEVGVNKTQDEACDKLIEIIQPLLIKGKDDSSSTGGFEKSLGASQQALGISKKLGDKCKVTLIDITAPVEEEEVEVEVEEEEIEEEIEEEEEEATVEESINEELEEEESYDLIVQIVDEEGNLETIYYGFPDIDIDLTADENIEQEVEVEEEEESEVEAEEEEVDVEATLINFAQTKAPENKTNPWADVDYKAKYSSGFTGGNYTTLNAF